MQDSEGNDIEPDMQRCTMGIYVISTENGEILDNTGSAAHTCAVMLGVVYALNLCYPKELRHYHEFIQKVLMRMVGEKPKSSARRTKLVLDCRNSSATHQWFYAVLWFFCKL